MHAAVSSVSAASENEVECGSGFRKAVQDGGADARECLLAASGAASDVEPQSKSKSARSARGEGLGRAEAGRAGMLRRSEACVRSVGARGRGDVRESKAISSTIGSDASTVRSRLGGGKGVPLSQSFLVPIAIATPNAAMFRRIESIAHVEV
eukprot:1069713-Pleurochrysis_carterae.AAC.6